MAESLPAPRSRKDRLIMLITLLRDGRCHRGQELARRLGVSARTLYRDMAVLMRSGVPVTGTPGRGYRMSAPVTLPGLNLSLRELEALHLGLAVMTEADDPALRAAARSLADKIDAALPENRLPESVGWGLALHPFADTGAGIRHIPLLRAAIRNRRQLRILRRLPDGSRRESVMQPLSLDYWGRIWTATALCTRSGERENLPLARIERLVELPPPQ